MPGIPLKVCPDSRFKHVTMKILHNLKTFLSQGWVLLLFWDSSRCGKPKGWQDWWCVMGWRMKVISAIHLRHWDILSHMPHEYISLDMVQHGWTPPIHSSRENENESLPHSLMTGDQCQLLTEGHSMRILGVKVRCTYSEADYPLMQAGRLSRTYECTLKSKSGMSAQTLRLWVPPVFASVPYNVVTTRALLFILNNRCI